MSIYQELVRSAERITARALPSFANMEDFMQWKQQRQDQYRQAIGIDTYCKQERTPLRTQITGTLQEQGFRIEKLHFESLPGLYVCANLYIPDGLAQPAPAILYLCGHARHQKAFYQDHPRRLAQLGFVTLVVDTIQLGEVTGYHHGTHRFGWFHWISKGYTPAGVEVWNAIRGLDLLSERSEVDPERLGVTGNSGGGSISWWLACADDRIKALAPSCGTGTIESHVREWTIDTHCDCVHPNNPYGWSLIEACALVAPKTLLIVTPDQDRHFHIDSVRKVHQRLKALYEEIGHGDHIGLCEFVGRHGYSEVSRTTIFSFFIQHLQGMSIPPEAVGDIDGVQQSVEALSVYEGRIPPNDDSTTVQDWFISPAHIPDIEDVAQFKAYKQSTLDALWKESFSHLSVPQHCEAALIQTSYEKNLVWTNKWSCKLEDGQVLRGTLEGYPKASRLPAPTAVYLRQPGDGKEMQSSGILEGLDESWLQARIDVLGTGLSSWGNEQTWYVRRSLALMGRTITSMRVQETLIGLKAIRSMKEVDASRIILAGEGEMAVVAMFAALLDGNVQAVVLKNPPDSLDTPDSNSGLPVPIELINALRHCDLPQAAGLLWPIPILFLESRPSSYRWTEQLYRKLHGSTWRLPNLSVWNGLPQ